MVGRHSKKARGQSRRYARKPSVWSEIRGYLLTVIAVMLVVLLGRTFVFNVYVIPSRSMEDTLQIGDRVFASRLTPRLFTLHRGDIIVFKDPADWMEGEQLPTNLMSIIDSNRYLIKRVIGLPGDTVACKGSGEPIWASHPDLGGVPCALWNIAALQAAEWARKETGIACELDVREPLV